MKSNLSKMQAHYSELLGDYGFEGIEEVREEIQGILKLTGESLENRRESLAGLQEAEAFYEEIEKSKQEKKPEDLAAKRDELMAERDRLMRVQGIATIEKLLGKKKRLEKRVSRSNAAKDRNALDQISSIIDMQEEIENLSQQILEISGDSVGEKTAEGIAQGASLVPGDSQEKVESIESASLMVPTEGELSNELPQEHKHITDLKVSQQNKVAMSPMPLNNFFLPDSCLQTDGPTSAAKVKSVSSLTKQKSQSKKQEKKQSNDLAALARKVMRFNFSPNKEPIRRIESISYDLTTVDLLELSPIDEKESDFLSIHQSQRDDLGLSPRFPYFWPESVSLPKEAEFINRLSEDYAHYYVMVYSPEKIIGLLEVCLDFLDPPSFKHDLIKSFLSGYSLSFAHTFDEISVNLVQSLVRKLNEEVLALFPEFNRRNLERMLQSDFSQLRKMRRELVQLKEALSIVELPLLLSRLEDSREASRALEDKSVFCLLGMTGAGKSTMSQFLLGSQFEEEKTARGVHLKPISQSDEHNKFHCSSAMESITRAATVAPIPSSQGYWLCDTPGFGDTAGALKNISNGLSTKKALENARVVYPIVLINIAAASVSRGQSLPMLVENILALFPEANEQFEKITFLLTHCGDKDRESIIATISDKVHAVAGEITSSEPVISFLEKLETRLQDECNIVDVLRGSRIEWIEKIATREPINQPSQYFKSLVSPDSLARLERYMHSLENRFYLAIDASDFSVSAHLLLQIKGLTELLASPNFKARERNIEDRSQKKREEIERQLNQTLKPNASYQDEAEWASECVALLFNMGGFYQILAGQNNEPYNEFTRRLKDKVSRFVQALAESAEYKQSASVSQGAHNEIEQSSKRYKQLVALSHAVFARKNSEFWQTLFLPVQEIGSQIESQCAELEEALVAMFTQIESEGKDETQVVELDEFSSEECQLKLFQYAALLRTYGTMSQFALQRDSAREVLKSYYFCITSHKTLIQKFFEQHLKPSTTEKSSHALDYRRVGKALSAFVRLTEIENIKAVHELAKAAVTESEYAKFKSQFNPVVERVSVALLEQLEMLKPQLKSVSLEAPLYAWHDRWEVLQPAASSTPYFELFSSDVHKSYSALALQVVDYHKRVARFLRETFDPLLAAQTRGSQSLAVLPQALVRLRESVTQSASSALSDEGARVLAEACQALRAQASEQQEFFTNCLYQAQKNFFGEEVLEQNIALYNEASMRLPLYNALGISTGALTGSMGKSERFEEKKQAASLAHTPAEPACAQSQQGGPLTLVMRLREIRSQINVAVETLLQSRLDFREPAIVNALFSNLKHAITLMSVQTKTQDEENRLIKAYHHQKTQVVDLFRHIQEKIGENFARFYLEAEKKAGQLEEKQEAKSVAHAVAESGPERSHAPVENQIDLLNQDLVKQLKDLVNFKDRLANDPQANSPGTRSAQYFSESAAEFQPVWDALFSETASPLVSYISMLLDTLGEISTQENRQSLWQAHLSRIESLLPYSVFLTNTDNDFRVVKVRIEECQKRANDLQMSAMREAIDKFDIKEFLISYQLLKEDPAAKAVLHSLSEQLRQKIRETRERIEISITQFDFNAQGQDAFLSIAREIQSLLNVEDFYVEFPADREVEGAKPLHQQLINQFDQKQNDFLSRAVSNLRPDNCAQYMRTVRNLYQQNSVLQNTPELSRVRIGLSFPRNRLVRLEKKLARFFQKQLKVLTEMSSHEFFTEATVTLLTALPDPELAVKYREQLFNIYQAAAKQIESQFQKFRADRGANLEEGELLCDSLQSLITTFPQSMQAQLEESRQLAIERIKKQKEELNAELKEMSSLQSYHRIEREVAYLERTAREQPSQVFSRSQNIVDQIKEETLAIQRVMNQQEYKASVDLLAKNWPAWIRFLFFLSEEAQHNPVMMSYNHNSSYVYPLKSDFATEVRMVKESLTKLMISVGQLIQSNVSYVKLNQGGRVQALTNNLSQAVTEFRAQSKVFTALLHARQESGAHSFGGLESHMKFYPAYIQHWLATLTHRNGVHAVNLEEQVFSSLLKQLKEKNEEGIEEKGIAPHHGVAARAKGKSSSSPSWSKTVANGAQNVGRYVGILPQADEQRASARAVARKDKIAAHQFFNQAITQFAGFYDDYTMLFEKALEEHRVTDAINFLQNHTVQLTLLQQVITDLQPLLQSDSRVNTLLPDAKRLATRAFSSMLDTQVVKWREICRTPLSEEKVMTAIDRQRKLDFYQPIAKSYFALMTTGLAAHLSSMQKSQADQKSVVAEVAGQIEVLSDRANESIIILFQSGQTKETVEEEAKQFEARYHSISVLSEFYEKAALEPAHQQAAGELLNAVRRFESELKRAFLDKLAQYQQTTQSFSPTESQMTLIRLKRLAFYISSRALTLNTTIDTLLREYQRQDAASVETLAYQLKKPADPEDESIAHQLMAEQSIFKHYERERRNQKTLTYTADLVIADMKQWDKKKSKKSVPNSDLNPVLISDWYDTFSTAYWQLVDAGLDYHGPQRVDFIKRLVAMTRELSAKSPGQFSERAPALLTALQSSGAEMKSLALTSGTSEGTASEPGAAQPPRPHLSDPMRSKLVRLLSCLFAYWTLSHSVDEDAQPGPPPLPSDLGVNVEGGPSEVKMGDAHRFLLQPHAAQVISILRLLGFDSDVNRAMALRDLVTNHLVQIRTGEGKSITLAISAILFALSGYDVSVACYSEYLSVRDHSDFKAMFSEFKVQEKIHYSTFHQGCDALINDGSDIRTDVADMLAGRSVTKPLVQQSKRVLLIDEVDVFFSEDFYGNSYQPLAEIASPEFRALVEHIWSQRTDLSALRVNVIKQGVEYQNWQRTFGGCSSLVDEILKGLLVDLMNFKDHQYVVQNGRVGYYSAHGLIFNMRYRYKTMYAYFDAYEKGNTDRGQRDASCAMLINCGQFSYAEVPSRYDHILGVTGTLETLSPAERGVLSQYGIDKYTYMPSVYGREANILGFSGDTARDVIIDDTTKHHFMIAKEIRFRLRHDTPAEMRSVLVFFESEAKIEAFLQSPQGRQLSGTLADRLRRITKHMPVNQKSGLIAQAASLGYVTLMSREFGRGTDFKSYDSRLSANGGVHVIQTFFADNVSEEVQIKGRTARQGDKGSFSMVLSSQKIERYGITARDLEVMEKQSSRYTRLNEARNTFFEEHHRSIAERATALRKEHQQSMAFRQRLRASDEKFVAPYLVEKNEVRMVSAVSRTVVLMDATGSMSSLIDKTKHSISEMFRRAYDILQKQNVLGRSFSIKFIAYRNYNAPAEALLQESTWESEPASLESFLTTVEANYGWENEAIEVAFQRVNQIIAGGETIDQVILIGDRPPNTRSEVSRKRSDEHGESYWRGTAFSTATYYEDELNVLTGGGSPVPVHGYYVDSSAQAAFSEIARRSQGQAGYLDVNSPNSAEVLTNLVTESILHGVGGLELVEAYRESYGFVASGPILFSGQTTDAKESKSSDSNQFSP